MILLAKTESGGKKGAEQLTAQFIRKTCLCDIHPLTPHFYIAKLGFTGIYIIFLVYGQNINSGYTLEPPQYHAIYVLSMRQFLHYIYVPTDYIPYSLYLVHNVYSYFEIALRMLD